MKKQKIILISILIIMLIIGIAVFSNKIIQTKNIKDSLEIKRQNEEITIIDVTNLSNDSSSKHDCNKYLVDMYDANKHWNECRLCGKRYEEKNHTYIDNGWSFGSANNCSENNIHKFSCNCGHSYTNTTGRKSHTYVSKQDVNSFSRYDICSSCSNMINVHKCYKSDLKPINCTNLGICAKCGYQYTRINIHYEDYPYTRGPGNAYCCLDRTTYVAKVNYCYQEVVSKDEIKLNLSITFPNGAQSIHRENTLSNMGDNISCSYATNVSGYTIADTITVRRIGWILEKGKIQFYYNCSVNGLTYGLWISFNDIQFDVVPPIISSIEIENNNDWNTQKIIKISGTDNYARVLNVKILDDKNNVVYSGDVTPDWSANSYCQYSVLCTPETEADEIGKTFTAVVTDDLGNESRQEFTIKKIDYVSPKAISSNIVNDEWTKEKNFTFKATDEGIGNIKIAFNNEAEYGKTIKSEETYSREYTFIGDVYKPKELSVAYKDELENISIQTITIDKLDNTAPTITNAELENSKLIITSNDIKEGIGEGSGVIKYRYITSTEKLENPEIPETAVEVNSNENIIIENISKIKYIYIVAEDFVRKCK